MDFSTKNTNSACRATIAGEVSFADHSRFRDLIADCLSSPCETVVVDLQSVEKLASAALGLLLLVHEQCADQGKAVSLCPPTGGVAAKFLEVARFHELIPYFDAAVELALPAAAD